MAQYPKATLTNSGLDLIGESIAEGKALIFTKVVLGDGQLSTGQDIKTLTKLINSLLFIPLTSGSSDSGKAKLRFAISNSELDTGFFAREVGVFAKVGEDGTEQLYAYTNGGNYVDYVPDKSNPIDDQIMDIYVVTGNAETVQILVDSAAYVTIVDLAEHNTDENAHSSLFKKCVKKAGDTLYGFLHLETDATPADDDDSDKVPCTSWVVKYVAKAVFAVIAALASTSETGVSSSGSFLGVNWLIAQNGYISFGKLFGGLILQWGIATVTNANGIVTLPLTVTKILTAIVSYYNAQGNSSYNNSTELNDFTTTSFNIHIPITVNTQYCWITISK